MFVKLPGSANADLNTGATLTLAITANANVIPPALARLLFDLFFIYREPPFKSVNVLKKGIKKHDVRAKTQLFHDNFNDLHMRHFT